MSDQQSTAQTEDDERNTEERRDERAKWTKDIAEIFRGFIKDPDYQAYLKAADFLDPGGSDAMVASTVVYLLWSNRHNAYWMPDSAGYTDDVNLAGRYSEAEAVQKVVASAHCGIRTQVTCMVAAPDNWKSVA